MLLPWAKELPTLKDNDFINEGQKIYIDDNNKKVFLEKLKKDVEVRKKKKHTNIRDGPLYECQHYWVFRSF
ncbi:PIP4K2A [Cervus elaphus hippelaphus]|uniref:PIP4K2A n=1 Tax=Cervus elaphus hippelaphus TaxID=46360 RepID=A0A212CBP0_CEREH|nr:PIP4K2A [Cervus elaphus hippelaphus]